MLERTGNERGVALISVMMLLALLMSLLVGFYALTRIESSTTKSSMNSFRGFYAAEAGLNLRAGLVRIAFQGFWQPTGTSPDPDAAKAPCEPGNLGTGDLACVSYDLQNRTIDTYLEESEFSPSAIVIPRGEIFQNLSASEFEYAVFSRATSPHGVPEALLEMHFLSRLVSLFQFAAFYDKDLEILHNGSMTLAGPMHTNGDLYLGTDGLMSVTGQITTSGDMYRGRKDSNTCLTGPVRVADPDNLIDLPDCSGDRLLYGQGDFDAWQGMIQTGIDPVTVQMPEAIDPAPGQIFWDQADARIVLDLDLGEIQVRDASGGKSVGASNLLSTCGAVGLSGSFFNNREGKTITMLDVDLGSLLDCLQSNNIMGGGKRLDDDTDGGLVVFLSVDGTDSDDINNYGVRVSNGAELASSVSGAPPINGLTIVSDQAMYVQGDYNTVEKKPASLLADSFNLLSNAWNDDTVSEKPLSSNLRNASNTSINAALMAGTDTTGGTDGVAGQDLAGYNGGLESLARLHEDWNGQLLTMRGSFVSLDEPRHVQGAWSVGGSQFRPPTVSLSFDASFRDPTALPPLSPRLVYLRQELFVRQF